MIFGTCLGNGLTRRAQLRLEWWIADDDVELGRPVVIGVVCDCGRVKEVALSQVSTSQLVELQAAPNHWRIKEIADGQGETEGREIDSARFHLNAVN